MSKNKLFEEDLDEEEVSFKIENEYAKKYDNWREKEELHKLEQKYGSKALSSDASVSSDSEDDDDEPPEVPEEVETQFLKTLAFLKTKDPRIYDPNFKAFDDKEEKKEEEKPASKTLTFEDSDDSDSEDDGNIFKVEKKAEIAPVALKKTGGDAKKHSKEAKIKDFLRGKAEHIDEDVEQDLAPLKALWSDPQLNEGEAFLRDYILNKRYLEEGDAGDADGKVRDDEELEEDERQVEEQGKFERAYNFRFEEPDDEFLKRYPRTMNYTRPKDDRRSKKRAEVRTRKEEEKKKKMEEIARMKALKLKEIQEKIAKIKEVTGNQDLAFKEDDIEGDFDPEEHDRRMKALFDEQYYGDADDQKPVFPDLDEELEIENWDKYEQEVGELAGGTRHSQNEDGPHCEDEDFNMDADYDPKEAKAKLIEEIQSTLGKKRRNRKKKSKLADLLSAEKPKFVPTVAEKSYNEYMEEYYKMDCEDVIGGDLPTRFKYREVVPNDFGLSIEEILLADDKELTQWVPLKKIVKHRSRDVEKSEVNTYRQKAADERLKKKILPSLFKDLPEEPEIVVPIEEGAKKKKKKKKKKNKEKLKEEEITENIEEENTEIDEEIEPKATADDEQNGEADNSSEVKTKKKKKKRKHKDSNEDTNQADVDPKSEVSLKNTEENVESTDVHAKEVNEDRKKKKRKESENSAEGNDVILEESKNTEEANDVLTEDKHKKRKKKHKVQEPKNDQITQEKIKEDANAEINTNKTSKGEVNSQVNKANRNKKKKHKSGGFVVENIHKAEPSQPGHDSIKLNNKNKLSNADNKSKSNLKRKSDQAIQGPNKKQKKFDSAKTKGSKFKPSSNQQGKDQSSDNPLNKLSDERLKAYGLNPKKYRSFLKYKKF